MKKSKIESVGKECLQLLCNGSSSYKEVLYKLGLTPIGNNYKTLHKYIEKFGISTEHIDNHRNKLYGHPKYKDKYTFIESIENGKCLSHSNVITNKLVEFGIKKYQCEICGISEWNNKYIRLELHHINGDHGDNKLSNLQLLCPNCHSQTDNFRALNMKS